MAEAVQLSSLDLLQTRNYIPLPLVFKVDPEFTAAALLTLQQSLEKLLQDVPLLKGCVTAGSHKSEVEVTFPHSTLELLVQDYRKDSRDFRLPHMPPIVWSSDHDQAPVFSAQFNKVQGGIILCVCLHHSVVDATGAACVLKRWSQWCRAVSLCNVPVPFDKSCLDRSALINGECKRWINEAARDDSRKATDQSARQIPNTIGQCFRFQEDKIRKLKSDIVSSLDGTRIPNRWVSANDVRCAVIFHAITQARLKHGSLRIDKPCTLVIPVNIRDKITPSLHPSYIGNAVVDVTAKLPTTTLAEWTLSALSRTALAIRHAIFSVNSQNVPPIADDVSKLDGLSLPDTGPRSPPNERVSITSWLHIETCTMDWGPLLGVIEERPPRVGGPDGHCMILPRRRDDSVFILIGLTQERMCIFKKNNDFLQYADEVDN